MDIYFIDVTPSKGFDVSSVRTDITNIFFQRCFAGNPLDEKEYNSFISEREEGSTMVVKTLQETISPRQNSDLQNIQKDKKNINNEASLTAQKTYKTGSKRKNYQSEEQKNSEIEVKNNENSNEFNESSQQTSANYNDSRRKRSPDKSYISSHRAATTYRANCSTGTDESQSENEKPCSYQKETTKSRNREKRTRQRLSSRRTAPSSRGRKSYANYDSGIEEAKTRKTSQVGIYSAAEFETDSHESSTSTSRHFNESRRSTIYTISK